MTRSKLSMRPRAAPANEPDPASIFAALFSAATDASNCIGMPVVIEDDALHAALKQKGHNLTTSARQQLAGDAGFFPCPERWDGRTSELRVISTGSADPRPTEQWDDHLWLSPTRLLLRDEQENKQ